MEKHFLYIDDVPNTDAKEKIQGFEKEGYLRITSNQPKSTWEEQLSYIKECNDDQSVDGLILDLRLDDYPNEDQKKANFRGTSLAQEIRTRQKEGNLHPFPIILFSGNDKIEQSLENSGRDLFDICIDKGSINGDSYLNFRPKFYALAEGYKTIFESKKDMKGLLSIELLYLDERFLFEFEKYLNYPTHIVSSFILKELIEKQGLLIDEQTLAAKLGVDISNSGDWLQLLDSISKTKYMGIFHQGWRRWWAPLLEAWWQETISEKIYLRSIPALRRIELIKEKTGLDALNPADKIEKAESTEFWTICRGYNKPLDPIDGLIIEGQENLFPWQDPEYVSIDAALKRKNVSKWINVAKLEIERLNDLKDQFRKDR